MGPQIHLAPAVIVAIAAYAFSASDGGNFKDKLPTLPSLQGQFGTSGGAMQSMAARVMNTFSGMVPAQFSSLNGQLGQGFGSLGSSGSNGILQALTNALHGGSGGGGESVSSLLGSGWSDGGSFDAVAMGLATSYGDAGDAAADAVQEAMPRKPAAHTTFIF